MALVIRPAVAQTLELRVRDDTSSAAIAGAIVRLQGPKGVAARGLTNELGLLTLHTPIPGTYRLRIDRIGWVGMTTDSITLAAGQTLRLVIPMSSRRNLLPTLEVRAKSRCDAKAQGGELAGMLWSEIQKALFANVITQSQRAVPLHLKEFVREVSLEGQPVREWVAVSKIVRGQTFRSLSPASLAREGFVRVVDDSTEYAAPDAALLLSDEFVATHCFQAVPGTGGRVGLAFVPIPGRKVADISGTMWVNRVTSELENIDYIYTSLGGVLAQATLGGRVEFRQLSGGAWVVSEWHIRMPKVETKREFSRSAWRDSTMLVSYVDHGGHAVVALDAAGRFDRAILRGQVYDSVSEKGLAGALVWIRGLPDSMYTDTDGRYEMAVPASGDHIVSVRHPRLGVLNESTTRVALLSLDDTTTVNFTVPSMAAFERALCRNRNPPGTVSIVGVALRADGTPAIDQLIAARPRAVPGKEPTGVAPMRTTRNGLFGLCRVPARDTVQLVMSFGKLTLVEIPVALAGKTQWIDLREWGSRDTTSRVTPPAKGGPPKEPLQ